MVSPDPSLDFTVPSGTTEIVVALRDLEGGRRRLGYPYRLAVHAARRPGGFDLALNDAQISIPKGGSAAIAVTVARKGYDGPITLDVANLPPGLSVRTGLIGAGQVAGAFTVAASADAAFDRVDLEVVGRAQGPTGPLVVPGSKLLVFAQQAGTPAGAAQAPVLPTNVLTQVGLPAASALPPALTLETPSTPVEVVHGFGGAVPIKVARPKGAEGALTITPLPPPPGFAVPNATVADKAAEELGPGECGGRGPIRHVDDRPDGQGEDRRQGPDIRPAGRDGQRRPPGLGRAGPDARREAGLDGRGQGKTPPQGDVQGAGHCEARRAPRRPLVDPGDGGAG